jgi:manganese transport protein
MGTFASPAWVTGLAVVTSAIILFLNGWLINKTFHEYIQDTTVAYLLLAPVALLLVYLILEKWLPRSTEKAKGLVLDDIPAVAGDLPAYRSILVPLDHSKSDAGAIRHAAFLARQTGARLLLLHVEEGATSQVYGQDSSTSEVTEGIRYLSSIHKFLLNQNIESETFVHHATSPAAEIVRFARANPPDLIVMAGHGHGVLGDLVYGQTIERVRHALKIPIFVVQ